MTTIKKGYGSPTRRGNSQLRSPVIKRSPSAPVTLQGWLHKQGSDGLMLWKKRWFVLSEYCLFYYKTPEEEKLLGSILLPSYKISPCGTDDKIYRKFSFKAEHANMRTYYFAADTQALMAQWMNALSLASILQENSSWEDRKSNINHQKNLSADDSDSGFHGHFRPVNDTGDCGTPSNGWRPPSQGYHQPLYANAPPKPRRLNNDTSSPERSPERGSDDGRLAQPAEYLRNDRAYNYTAQHQHSHRPPLMLPATTQPQERRTPDTYGRSNTNTPQTGKVISSKPKTLDYEDVYQTNPDLINSMYAQNAMYTNQPVQYRQNRRVEVMSNSMPSGTRKRFPPRPHSADFLEYDTKRAYQSPTPLSSDSGNQLYYNQRTSSQPRRPKSSLDIVHADGGFDGTHWSEESYARKMRQSASYVSPQIPNLSNSSRATTPSVRQLPDMSPGYYNGSINGELASVTMRQHSQAIHMQGQRWSEYVDRTSNGQFMRSASARLPRHADEERLDDNFSEKSYQEAFRRRNSTDNRDSAAKSQQREESMKRLLEWKQRMLQSPLSRKNSGSSSRGTAQNQLSQYYQQTQALRELNHHQSRSRSLTNETQPSPEAWKRDGWDKEVLEHTRVARRKHSDTAGRSRSQDGRRSVTSINRYNSYSSDDEELEGTRECRKRARRSSKEVSRSRVNSLEGKSPRTIPTPSSFPDYENVKLSEKTNSKDKDDTVKIPLSLDEIVTESDYLNLLKNDTDELKERNYTSRNPHKKIPDDFEPGESFDSGNTLAGSSILGYEDRFTISSKHSDSGYDTLQTGGILPVDPDVNDLLKFRFDKKTSPHQPVVAYPVQTKPAKNFESWGEKLDESRLIKEFSYQYIKTNKNDGKNFEDDNKEKKNSKVLLTKRFDVPPQNIVQNRIKVFETTKEDESANQNKEIKLKMQEPLQVSSPVYQPNEAHVSSIRTVEIKRESPKRTEEEMSNLRRSRRTSLHGFALGDAISMLDEEAKYSKREMLANGKNPKSVKDLLADFEKKSQLAKEKLAAEEKNCEDQNGKRCVLSDTETLLYDTSSDIENNQDEAIMAGFVRGDLMVSEDDEDNDEDRDEEVAAVLGQKDSFISSCRDIGRKQDSKQRKKKVSNSSSTKDSLDKFSPALQLHLSETVIGQSESHVLRSTPQSIKSKLEESKLRLSSSPEQHYMPMTPSKKPPMTPVNDVFSHTRNSSASQSFSAEVDGEESSYVEMTNGNIRSLLAPDSAQEKGSSSTLTDAQNYCEIGSEKDTHYEFLYKASSNNMEPLYMEVNPLLEAGQGDDSNQILLDSSLFSRREETEGAEQPPTPPRIALPDILSPTSNTNGKASSVKSDSSDADDEASKDLDSLDAPRHPRFSLSDTFRPASYYLGASIGDRTLIGMTAEHPDSSDSDLVSPPPIPTSPPPLDDLETSLDSSIDIKKSSPVQMKSESCKIDIEGKDSSMRLWNPTPLMAKDLRSLHDRMEGLNISPIPDEMLSSETESIDSNKKDRLLKRRPVSADILNSLQDTDFLHCTSLSAGRQSGGSDLDSVGSRNGLAMDLEEDEGIDFDQYLEDLQSSTQMAPKLPVKDFKYGSYKMYDRSMYGSQNSSPTISRSEISTLNSSTMNSNDLDFRMKYKTPYAQVSATSKNDEVHYENLQGLFPPPPSAEFLQELSSENDTVVRYSSPEGGPSRSSPARIVEGQGVRDMNMQAGAPYYYSDLLKSEQENQANIRMSNISRSMRIQQLNNQREVDAANLADMNHINKRNDIGRRVNAIHQLLPGQVISKDEAEKLAEELRTTSVHFLGTADKNGLVDERNLYEADTLQRRKASTMLEQRFRSQTPDLRSSARNLYPQGIRNKDEFSNSKDKQPRRRSRSLEGLLDESEFLEPQPRQNRVSPGNAISRLLQTTQPHNSRSPIPSIPVTNTLNSSRSRAPPPPPDVWEEDALWRESLRRVSIRHTRSLDDLDRDSPREVTPAENRKVSREVTYVNKSVAARSRTNHREYEEDYREGRSRGRQSRPPTETEVDDGVHYERLVPRDAEALDRARRGQTYIEGYVWDEEREIFHRGEKSTLPIRDPPRKSSQPFLEVGLYPTRPPSFEIDREKLRQWDLMSSAPAGMLSAAGGGGGAVVRRGIESAPLINTTPPSSPASASGSVIGRDPLPPRQAPPVIDKAPPPSLSPTTAPPPHSHNPDLIHHKRPERSWSLQLSAGELLGRTHEELVLLLIQLRRQSAGFCKAMEACHMEIEAQARLVELETPKRMEHLQKLEDLKRHLLELEKQYEKGKPLVNLVDNMVKLGSLYRVGAPLPTTPLLRERLEFNHQVQERRLLAEERRDWERLSPDHNQLQAKVEQLYRLDRLLQEESGTLQSLQQDKEMLERALGGLRHKLQSTGSNTAQAEKYRRQQRLLERELSRVRSILAHNSKKLEETVAENARLEQELVVLRQKLSWSRRTAGVDQTASSTAHLEAELARVQSLVGDLQRQRLELSSQVRQLTERSNSLSQQIRPSPTGVQGVGAVGSKKVVSSSWLETDLDTQVTQDSPLRSPPQTSPLYVNTDVSKNLVSDVCSTYEGSVSQDEQQEVTSAPPTPQQAPPPPPPPPAPAQPTSQPAQYTRPMDISEADDRIKRFYGIIPRDKPQEIKTVRIVKRESERRQRDRDRSGNIGIPLTNTTTAKRVTIIEETTSPALPDGMDRGLGRVMEEMPEPPSEVYGGTLAPPRSPAAPPAPGPRSDSVQALRNLVNRQRARADSESTSPSQSVSAHEQLFGSSDTLLSPQLSPNYQSQLSPVYQSQAARQIVEEMAYNNRRTVPREKRRHHTVSGRPLLRIDTSYSAGGSRDDLDMERALRPRLNTPDVVRSTLSRSEVKYTTETIDNLLGTPGKILIPERYVPESTPELSSEEQQKRYKKAESIRKMLSETTQVSGPDDTNETVEEDEKSLTLKRKVAEEKRQREHLLQLNQILAQQVMEKSKMVAGSNAASAQD